MEDNKNKIKTEVGEDATKYGEFIPSYFTWVALDSQKKIVNKLETMTDNKNEKNSEKRKN